MNEVKQFDPKCGSFTANGKKYFVGTKLSIARYEEYEKLSPKMTFDLDFAAMFSGFKKVYGLLNDRKFADAAVVVHNFMSAIDDVRNEKRIHPALLMAALAINREGEDPGTFDQQIQEEKIADWRAEGFAIEGFFYFALNFIQGFVPEYNAFTADLKQEKVVIKS
jgi:hypothetical protein